MVISNQISRESLSALPKVKLNKQNNKIYYLQTTVIKQNPNELGIAERIDIKLVDKKIFKKDLITNFSKFLEDLPVRMIVRSDISSEALLFHTTDIANEIAMETKRGSGNIIFYGDDDFVLKYFSIESSHNSKWLNRILISLGFKEKEYIVPNIKFICSDDVKPDELVLMYIGKVNTDSPLFSVTLEDKKASGLWAVPDYQKYMKKIQISKV
jgi:hypothetical protein